MKALLWILLLPGIGLGSTLRIAEVVKTDDADAERMTLKFEHGEEQVFVKKETVISDQDVETAVAELPGEIGVKLKPAGAGKLKAVTGRMIPGRDRLAIIVEGRLISAPVVQSALGGSFQISGLTDFDAEGLDDLARKMSGRPPRAPGDVLPAAKPEVQVERVPFSEEEYQQTKAMRERIGIFHLEKVPSEEELAAALREGMSQAEVVAVFGRPYFGPGKVPKADFELTYSVAPEKCPDNPKREGIPDGFKADFVGGKLVGWSHTYSNRSKELKVVSVVGVVAVEPGILTMTLPELDFSEGDPDLIGLFEGVKIPNPQQKVNRTDLNSLLSLATMLATPVGEESDAKPVLDVDCDLMQTLAHHFPEVTVLRKNAVAGKVSVESLHEALSPYVMDGKALPGDESEGPQK